MNSVGGHHFALRFKELFHLQFRPIGGVLADSGVADSDAILPFRLDFRIVDISPARVVLSMDGAEALRRPSGGPCDPTEKDTADGNDELDVVHKMIEQLGFGDENDCDSVVEDDDSESACDLDGEYKSEEDDKAKCSTDRHPLGTFVQDKNDYYTFTNNTNFPDVKVRFRPRWSIAEHLGAGPFSRAVTPAHLGEPRERLVRAFLVLRSWALWRVGQSGFDRLNVGRRKWFVDEFCALRKVVVDMSSSPCPTIGHPSSDNLILHWTLGVLAVV